MNNKYYDEDGYDESGFDRDGYNREGFDQEGFDREGYDYDDLDIDFEPRPKAKDGGFLVKVEKTEVERLRSLDTGVWKDSDYEKTDSYALNKIESLYPEMNKAFVQIDRKEFETFFLYTYKVV